MKPRDWVRHQGLLAHATHKSPPAAVTPVDTLAILLESGAELLAETGAILDTES